MSVSDEERDRIVEENDRRRGHIRRDSPHTLELTREELAIVRDALMGYRRFLLENPVSQARLDLTHDVLERVLQMEFGQ